MKKDFGCKTWLFPQPVIIIGTYDKNGNANAMNAAWGGMYESCMTLTMIRVLPQTRNR